ncbi:MAG: hypothetical protein EA402_04300 [Planctomycetota bacterium]|nr:MAG: hypothetical protein EA402_04300 [Planctomycetota bacterium]
MLETLHQLLHSGRWVILLITLGGMGYAMVLYYRAISSLSLAGQAQQRQRHLDRRERKRVGAGRGRGRAPVLGDDRPTTPMDQDDEIRPADPADETADEIDDEAAAPIAPVSDDGPSQGDFFSALPDDSLPTKIKAADNDNDTDTDSDSSPIETDVHTAAKSKTAYNIDQNARTRHDLQRPEETRKYGVNESVTTQVRRRDNQAVVKRNDASRAPTEPIPSPEEKRPTKVAASDEELLRRATRMEELGFHVGIVPEQLRQDPSRVSANEKQDLLKTLGLLEQKAKDAHLITEPASPESAPKQVDLDDILARLDSALATSFEDTAEAQPPASDKEEDPATSQDANAAEESGPSTAEQNATEDKVGSSDYHSNDSLVTPDDTEAPAVEPANTTPDPDEDPIDAPPKAPPARSPRNKKMPDWARADTFDEDLGDDGDGKQLDLFGKPPQ